MMNAEKTERKLQKKALRIAHQLVTTCSAADHQHWTAHTITCRTVRYQITQALAGHVR